MRDPGRFARPHISLAHLAGATITMCVWSASDGAILQDEIAHFLIAKRSWQNPELLLDVWGRAGNTLTYVLPAQGGLHAARGASLLLALLTAVVTTRIARALDLKLLTMVPVLLWFQPWYSEMSFTVVTEVPFSLLLVTASWASLRQRHLMAALAFGCLPLIRHEGIVITMLWSAWAAAGQRWNSAALVWLPGITYNLLTYTVLGSWPFAIMLDPQASPLNDSGGWLHFVPRVVANAGLPVIVLALAGTRRLMAASPWLVCAYVAYFATHVVLFRFGLFKTGGYSLFLLPLAPALAVAATMGLEELRSILGRSETGQRRWRVTLAVVVVTTIANAVVAVAPHRLGKREIALREAAAWLESAGADKESVIASRVWVYYFADLEWSRPRPWAAPIELDRARSGTFLVWDSRQAPRRGAPYEELSSSPDRWEEMWASDNRAAVIFRRR